MLEVLLIATGAVLFAALVLAAIVSWDEHEPRAVKRFLGLVVLAPLPFVAVAAVPGEAGQFTGIALLAVAALAALALLVPTGSKHRAERDTPTGRIEYVNPVRPAGKAQNFIDWYGIPRPKTIFHMPNKA